MNRKWWKLIYMLPITFCTLYAGGYVAQFIRNYQTWESAGNFAGNGTAPQIPSPHPLACLDALTAFPYNLYGIFLCLAAFGLLTFLLMRMGFDRNGEITDRGRNLNYSTKGTYGTSGFMTLEEMHQVLELTNDVKKHKGTILGKLNGKAKIELETYIQMAYFDRILRRANLRFMTMSSGQYELKRQKAPEDKKGKSGLELNVIDHYNGSERSVKTLSGGESFQASLSLALGLSDEIQANAGGICLEAMFVDEGFGSLDEEALEQAIKALGNLTQGNRSVGIISHVAELKERIENKIIVTKERGGEKLGSRIAII